MNSANYVDSLIASGKASGQDLMTLSWDAAKACVGWPYVFGGRGQLCTPSNRRSAYRDAHPTIKTKCKNFNGNGTCNGCQWYPEGQRTRYFDCRGYTYWILLQVYGWKLMGTGATSQWNTADNWQAKGTIDSIPEDKLVCLFVQKGNTMEHTGFGYKGQTLECSSGVQYFAKRNKKWTHWGLPACIHASPQPTPEPQPEPTPAPGPDLYRPTLRKGDKGIYVVEMQNDLLKAGEKLPRYGADGDFGNETLAAVKSFQKSHPPLAVDGICGPKTWAVLMTYEGGDG